MNALQKVTILILLTIPVAIWAESSFELGYNAFVQDDYHTAIEHFKKSTQKENEPNAWLYLGWSYLRLNQLDQAKKALIKAYELDNTFTHLSRKQYNRAVDELDKAFKSFNFIKRHVENKSDYKILWIVIISLGFISVCVVFVLWYIKKKKITRKYKFHPVNSELALNLSELNEHFRDTRDIILKSNNQDRLDDLGEIEDRCIALNDKLEELKYGLRIIDEEIFKDEIETTIEMIDDCISRLENTPKSS